MSLLLKALKKAEQQAQEKPAPTVEPTLDPSVINSNVIQPEASSLAFPTLEFEPVIELSSPDKNEVAASLPPLVSPSTLDIPSDNTLNTNDLVAEAYPPAFTGTLLEVTSQHDAMTDVPNSANSQQSELLIASTSLHTVASPFVSPLTAEQPAIASSIDTPQVVATPNQPSIQDVKRPIKRANEANSEALTRQFMLFKLQQLSASSRNKRPLLLGVLLVLGIALAGTAFWYWNSQATLPPTARQAVSPMPPTETAQPNNINAPLSSSDNVAGPGQTTRTTSEDISKKTVRPPAKANPSLVAQASVQPAIKSEQLSKSSGNDPTSEASPKQNVVPPPTKNEPLFRKESPTNEENNLTLAYQSLARGNLPEAERYYQAALQQDRMNPDVYVGLGTIALRNGKLNFADAAFKRALELNPTNAYAQSMLLSMSNRVDSQGVASRLKTIATQTQSSDAQASTYTLLGNKFAGQGLWHEAQQAYFDAFNADPTNPDCAYNLAVSLEQIRQSKLAINYYRKSVDLAKLRTPGFDINLANNRLNALSSLPGSR